MLWDQNEPLLTPVSVVLCYIKPYRLQGIRGMILVEASDFRAKAVLLQIPAECGKLRMFEHILR
jgi:hypothetical protein